MRVVIVILGLPWAACFLSNNGRRGSPPRGPPFRLEASLSDSHEPPPSSTLPLFDRRHWNETHAEEECDGTICSRGGAQSKQEPVADVVKGTQATLSATSSFWGQTFGRLIGGVRRSIASVGKKVSKRFSSPEKRKEQELLEQLQTMPVKQVVVKDSQVLPKEVVQIATRRAGLLGKPLRTERVQEFAQSLKQWYDRHGYVLHSVTGATLETSTATAEIQVQEPVSSAKPVNIIFCKEMIIEPETGELITMRQYKDRYAVKKRFGAVRGSVDLNEVNTTLIETDGRTNPSRVAKALGLYPNRPFQWNPKRWKRISQSGVFSRVIRATPQPLSDGTVQLNIVAQEAPTRHLEYGLGKSLYTGSWEGELDFEHGNLLGGGEVVGLSVRRGTRDAEPSVCVRFSDDRFGLEGGYDVEAFSEYIGDVPEDEVNQKATVTAGVETPTDSSPPGTIKITDYDHDALISRRGATFRLRNPFNPEVIRNSMMSASIEQTSTKTGLHEKIGSATLKLGPFRRALPMDAMSSIDTSITTGTRVLGSVGDDRGDSGKLGSSIDLKPFGSFTATTKQVIPVLETRTTGFRPLVLALQHSATLSSSHLPRHEAKAQGIANNIRGAKSNGRVSSALRGTTEIRIPVDIPKLPRKEQDASVVLFGDWLFATKDSTSPIFRKSSVGIGIRKSLQGLPLQCNLCYAGDGKIKTLFGLGRDFDA